MLAMRLLRRTGGWAVLALSLALPPLASSAARVCARPATQVKACETDCHASFARGASGAGGARAACHEATAAVAPSASLRNACCRFVRSHTDGTGPALAQGSARPSTTPAVHGAAVVETPLARSAGYAPAPAERFLGKSPPDLLSILRL